MAEDDVARAEGALALILVKALLRTCAPDQRFRTLQVAREGLRDLSVIPLTDGEASRAANATRELWRRFLDELLAE